MATVNCLPEVLRIEVMDLDAGDVAVVAQLDQEPSNEWMGHLRRIIASTPEMEEVVVRQDRYWLFFVGFGLATGLATHNRVARLIASTKEARQSPQTANVSRAALKKELSKQRRDRRDSTISSAQAIQI